MSRFVRPANITLTLANGDTIVIREELNAGETRAMFAQMYQAGENGTLQLQPLASGLALILAYLVDWSLKDDEGQPIVIKDLSPTDLTSYINNLKYASFQELKEAIEAHQKAQEKKKDPPAPESSSST